jgi:hypothetical protein
MSGRHGKSLIGQSTNPHSLSFVDFHALKFLSSSLKGEFMKIADLTVEELQALIKNAIHEELQALLTDPDTGRELTQEVEARLASSLQSTERVPFDEVKRRYNLH